ncbi:fibronectin type III domain-containing protein [Reichenbachiella versicolor]|uniref:fibronectin type III domain-containing protein n=1 Tax=Reichenbachiella versicolor TaxID=1821036 RepID=UPI000D6E6F5D|nr:hypothetical protein [Reichenbachiella versicolor]
MKSIRICSLFESSVTTIQRRVLLLTLILFISLSVNAQKSALYAINDPNQSGKVLLKWYSSEFLYNEGVNLYRKPSDGIVWEKVNKSPIFTSNDFSPTAVNYPDDDIRFLEEVILDSASSIAQLQETFLFVNVLFKSIQSKEYAEFLGIYFEDANAIEGKRYTYRVNKIKGDREFSIAESKPIVAGKFFPDHSIEEIDIYQEGQKLKFDWKMDEDRFYAVNIYKTEGANDTTYEQINDKPIIISEVQDSLGRFGYPTPKFSLDSLEEHQVYSFQVRGLGFFNEELASTEAFRFSFEDNVPPASPIGLVSEYDSLTVKLQWVNRYTEDVEGLRIYKSNNSEGPYQVVNEVLLDSTVNSFVDEAKINGSFYYKVATVDFSGNEGLSEYSFVKVPDVFPPATPTGLIIKSDTGRMHLTWNHNTESDLWGYLLFRTTSSNVEGDYLLLNTDPIDSNEYIQKLPINVKNDFFYKIVAVDTTYNRSGYSDFAKASLPDVLGPETPFIKNIRTINNKLVVEWVKNIDNDLKNYVLERRDTVSSEEYSVLSNALSRDQDSFTDSSAKEGIWYQYRLLAQDSAGNFSNPSAVAIASLPIKTSPIKISNLEVNHKKKKKINTLTWDIGSQEYVGIVVYRGASREALKPLSGMLKDQQFKDYNLGNGTKWHYQVRVFAESGDVSKSEVLTWKKN